MQQAESSALGGLVRFASANMIGRTVGRGLGLASFVLLARLGGEQTFGWIVLVFAWSSIAGMFAAVGLEWPVLRFTKLHLDTGRADLARGLIRLAETVPLIVGTAIGLILIVVLKLGTNIGGSWVDFAWFVPVVPLAAYLLVRRNLMLSLERPILALVPVNIIRPLVMLAIMLPLAAAAEWQLNYTAAAAALSMSFVIAAVWARLAARSDICSLLGTGASVRKTRSWTGIGLAMVLVTGGFLVLNQIDTLLLGALATLNDVAAYNSGYRIVSLMAMPLIAIQSATASRLSTAHTQGRIDDLHSITRWISRLAFLGTSIIFVGLLCFGSLILSMFGEHFTNARVPMLILAGAYLFSAWTGSTGYMMNMTNRQNSLAVIILLACALNVVGNLMLIPLWGMTGAAISTAFTIVAWNVAVIVLLHRSTGRWMLWLPGISIHPRPPRPVGNNEADHEPVSKQCQEEPVASTPSVLIIDPNDAKRARSAFVIQSLEAAGTYVRVVYVGKGLLRSYLTLHKDLRGKTPATYAICFAHGPKALAAWIAWKARVRGPFLVYLGGDPGRSLFRELNPSGSSRSLNIWPRLRLRLNLIITRFVLRRADAAICVSEYLASTIRRLYARQVVTIVIPPCTQVVSRQVDCPPAPRCLDLPLSVLTVTNLCFRSKCDGLIDVIKGLAAFCERTDLPVVFDVAGAGPFLTSAVSTSSSLELPDKLTVRFHGDVQDIDRLYKSASIFVYSSSYDAYPNVIVEAMSFGLPLLVVDHPLFDEFLSTRGRAARFQSDNSISFANALENLINSFDQRHVMTLMNLNLICKDRVPTNIGDRLMTFLNRLR